MPETAIPSCGWVGDVRVSRVKSGDTVEVTLTQVISVRLAGCFGPERFSRECDAAESARINLERIAPRGTQCRLVVPSPIFPGAPDRVLGRLVIVDSGLDVGEEQVQQGFATQR